MKTSWGTALPPVLTRPGQPLPQAAITYYGDAAYAGPSGERAGSPLDEIERLEALVDSQRVEINALSRVVRELRCAMLEIHELADQRGIAA